MAGGFIKLPREFRDSAFWPKRRRYTNTEALIDLKFAVNYAPAKVTIGNQTIHVPTDGLITSQAKLAARWGWDRRTVRSFLRRAESAQILHVQTKRGIETGYTLVVIENLCGFGGNSNGETWPADENEAGPRYPFDAHKQEEQELSLGRKNSNYGNPKSDRPDPELVRGVGQVDEIEPQDYWSMATTIGEAAILRKLPASTSARVAEVKRVFGKTARVIEVKPAPKPPATEPEQGRLVLRR